MKTILAAILLATSLAAHADLSEKSIKLVCGNQADIEKTVDAYKETAVMIGLNKEAGIANWLFVNMEKGTSSWIAQLIASDEWCMLGVGTQVVVPEGSPLVDTPVGTRIKFK